jgi:hypothetical protein
VDPVRTRFATFTVDLPSGVHHFAEHCGGSSQIALFNVTSSGLTKSTRTGGAYLRRSAVFEHVLEAPMDLQSLVVLRTA